MYTTLKKGSKGDLVKALQYIVEVDADGAFGTKTEAAVKSWQKSMGLTADGIFGEKSWNQLLTAAPTLKLGAKNKYVRAIESLLSTMKKDGVYSADEFSCIKAYQTAEGLTVDGIVGRNTYSRLFGITKKETAVKTDDGTNSKQPVNYKQYDSKWGSILYTKNNTYSMNQTIKSSGCGITSMADIIATWWDKSITPKETAADAVKNGYRTNNSGTAWTYFPYVAKKYGASKFIQTSSATTAISCLADGGYVIVSVGPSIWTSAGHFIVWWKYDGNYVYINDPASASSARAKNKLSTLKSAAKQYFCFWK